MLDNIKTNTNNNSKRETVENIPTTTQEAIYENISKNEKNDKNNQNVINSKNSKKNQQLDIISYNKYSENYLLNTDKERLNSKSNETLYKENVIDEKIKVNHIYNFETLSNNEKLEKKFTQNENENNIITTFKKQNSEETKEVIYYTNADKKTIDEYNSEISNINNFKIPLSRILELKDFKYMQDKIYDVDDLVNYTYIIFNNQKCILLVKNNFLYILESSPPIIEKAEKFFNPELSLLHQIEVSEGKFADTDIKKLKQYFNISEALISINFELLTCKLLIKKTDMNEVGHNNNEIKILILGYNESITFYIENYDTYQKFVKLIAKKIANSSSYYENKLGLVLSRNKFLSKTYITPKEFESKAKTGDILLFSTLDCCSKCQRILTKDKYDHIAVIKISHKKNIFI